MSDETLQDMNNYSIRQYRHWRGKYDLSEYQSKRVQEIIENFWFYRSDEPITVYKLYGLHEFPVVYRSLEAIDEDVADSLDWLDDDFEFCTEEIKITGREYGQLMADW